MEYVLFCFMMIVPVVSIAAFVITIINAKKIKVLKKLVSDLVKNYPKNDPAIRDAVNDYIVESI